MAFAKIYAVDDIDITLLKSEPPSLLILARGRTTSSGWRDPQLVQHIYITPPADGVLDLDFIAQAPNPGGIVLPVLSSIAAETQIDDIDVANYWGKGLPLTGIRVISVSNEKTAVFADPREMHPLRDAAAAKADNLVPVAAAATPSFEADIRPLFRRRDVSAMRSVAGWRLDNYDDVKANAAAILSRLEDGTMPCDGAWPAPDIELFQTWMNAGMAA